MRVTLKIKPKRLLSLLLSLTLVLGMIPLMGTTAMAASGSGTESNPYIVTTYDDLYTLMQSAPTDSVCYIKLGGKISYKENKSNYSLSLKNANQRVVLDLNGYKIDRSGTTDDTAVFNVDTGSLTVKSSTNAGGVVVNMSGSGTKTVFTVSGLGKLTVDNGSFESNGRALLVKGGNAVINGGNFITAFNYYTAVFQAGTVTVNGGHFYQREASCAIEIGGADVTFNACTINGYISAQKALSNYVSGEYSAILDDETVVNLQTYSEKTLGATGSSIRIIRTDGTQQYPYLADYYPELKKLMSFAPNDGSVCYIKLINDIAFESDEEGCFLRLSYSNQNVVLDLNGHTLSLSGATDDRGIFVLSTGKLTIKDSVGTGKVIKYNTDNTNMWGAVYVTDTAQVTIDGGTFINEDGCAVFTWGGTTVFNGGTFINSDGNAMVSWGGKITINGGSFVTDRGDSSGANFIYGTVMINGGEFINNRTVNTNGERYGIFVGSNANVTIHNCDTLGGIYTDNFGVIASGSVVTGINSDGTTYNVNDVEALGEAYKLQVRRLINQVAVTNIDVPKEGNKPDTTATVKVIESANAAVDWYDMETYEKLSSSDLFETGHTYMAMVTVNAPSDYAFATTNSEMSVTVNGEKGFLWLAYRDKVQCCYCFPAIPKEELSGTVTLSGAYYNTTVNPSFSDNLQSLSSAGKLTYQWQLSDSADGEWTDIESANSLNYTPVKENVSKYIRLVVSANDSYVASNSVKVGKCQMNFEKPSGFSLSVGSDYTTVTVSLPKATQEYLLSYDSQAPERDSEKWNEAKFILLNQRSITFTCEANRYVYIHTRIRESRYTVAGVYTETAGVYTGETATQQSIKFNYTNLDMKVGEVVKLTASPVPSNSSGWSGANWYVNGSGAKLYIDEDCTTAYYSSIHGYKTQLYLKGIQKESNITVGAEKTVGYNNLVRGSMNVRVADENGNYELQYLMFPDVTLAPGESATLDISTVPNPATIDGDLTFTKYANTSNNISVLGNATAKTVTITVPRGTAAGEYTFEAKVNGESLSAMTLLKVTVSDKSQEIPVDSISVLPNEITLAPGQSYTISTIIRPSNANVSGTVEWKRVTGSSSISIDSTGTVTVAADAKGGDTAMFRATYGGKVANCVVNVATPINNIMLNLTKPAEGSLPSAPTCVTTDYVDAGNMKYSWYVIGSENREMETSVERFKAGETYRICVELDAKDGCVFTGSIIPEINLGSGIENCIVSNNTVSHLSFYKIFTIEGQSSGVTVSGTATSWGSDSDDVIIQLTKLDEPEAAYETVVKGNTASYTIADVASGSYKMNVIKNKHVSREYIVTVGSTPVVQDIAIYMLGDVNMDGTISVNDVTCAQQIIAESIEFTSYQAELADFNRDGTLNVNDVTAIQTYIAGA